MLEKLIRSRTKRVRLNLVALNKAIEGTKRMAVASSIPIRGKGPLSPSTLTRYLSGERSPSIGRAFQIAQALGLDPVELILGYAEDKRAKPTTWENDVAQKGHLPFGIDLHRLVGQSTHYLKYLYVDVVEGGPYRLAFQTEEGEIGFASVPVRINPADLPSTIRFLYRSRFIPGLPLISEVGTVLIAERTIQLRENWTLREEMRPRRDPAEPFHLRFWQDKKATSFFLISEKPFDVLIDDRTVHVNDDEPTEPTVTFHPTGFHEYAPSPRV